MNPSKYSITFACHNAAAYTKLCIESFVETNTPLDRLVVVDNGSNDETRDYLNSLELGGRIFNSENLGCGVAWNQGILAQQSEWNIIMNNDVLVSPQWVENLILTAEKLSLKVVSPALIEGDLDYDFNDFTLNTTPKMRNVHRIGSSHAVCLAVHKSVWQDAGFFQATPKLLGYEDTLFFNELEKSGIQTARTGASWLHHFGSITQTALKQELGLACGDALGSRYNYKLLNKSWLTRKLDKLARKNQLLKWRNQEVAKYGMSIHGLRKSGSFKWL